MEKWTRLLIMTATVLLLLIFAGVGIRLAMEIHHTLLLFALAGLVAYALDPLVEAVRRTRLSREWSVTIVFIAVLAVLGLGLWSLSGHVAAQVSSISRDFPNYRQRALNLAAATDAKLAAHGVRYSIAAALQNPPPSIRSIAEQAGRDALPLVGKSFTTVGEALIVLLIALYFLIFGAEMREKFNALLPDNLCRTAVLWETDVNRILGGFVRGQLIIALLIGAAAAVGCLAIGIRPWLIIGLLVVVAALIPVFGPYLGAVPAVIAALIGPTHFHPIVAAVLVVIWFVLINEAGSKVLYPKLVGSALGLHTVLVLFVLFAGLELDNIVGVLFAAPVTALAIVTVVHLYRFWQDLPDNLLADVALREASSNTSASDRADAADGKGAPTEDAVSADTETSKVSTHSA